MNKSFNAFRAFAFLGVFFYHSMALKFGYLGVNAFFVLSGYLIVPILLQTKETTVFFKDFLKNFYGRRALRIFPPYYFYLIIVTLIIFLLGLQTQGQYKEFIKQLPWAISYTYDFYHSSNLFHQNNLLTHFWSLAVEEQFYIFFPLVIYFLPKRYLRNTLLALIILGPFIRLLIGSIADHNPDFMSMKNIVVYVLPFSHIDAFVIGGFFSVFVKNYVPSTITLISCFLSIFIIGIITAKIFTNSFQFTTLGYGGFMQDSYKYIWGYTLFNIFFSLVLLRLSRRNLCITVFENNFLNYLGKISYGLYIYHFAILNWVSHNLNLFHIYSSKLIIQHLYTTLIAFALTLAISVLSFELVEKIFLVWKDKLFSKHGDDMIIKNKKVKIDVPQFISQQQLAERIVFKIN